MNSLGEQVLQTLSFDHRSVWDAIFGSAMMIAGLLVAGVCVLHRNQLRYSNLGHVGSKWAQLSKSIPEADDNTSAAAATAGAGAVPAGAVASVALMQVNTDSPSRSNRAAVQTTEYAAVVADQEKN